MTNEEQFRVINEVLFPFIQNLHVVTDNNADDWRLYADFAKSVYKIDLYNIAQGDLIKSLQRRISQHLNNNIGTIRFYMQRNDIDNLDQVRNDIEWRLRAIRDLQSRLQRHGITLKTPEGLAKAVQILGIG